MMFSPEERERKRRLWEAYRERERRGEVVRLERQLLQDWDQVVVDYWRTDQETDGDAD